MMNNWVTFNSSHASQRADSASDPRLRGSALPGWLTARLCEHGQFHSVGPLELTPPHDCGALALARVHEDVSTPYCIGKLADSAKLDHTIGHLHRDGTRCRQDRIESVELRPNCGRILVERDQQKFITAPPE